MIYLALMNLTAVFLILAGGIVLTVGDVVMKSWVENEKISLYIVGLGIYLLGLMFLVQSFKYENIAEASIAMVVGNVITLTILSYFYFNEKISLLGLLGILLGIASFAILEFSSN